MNKKLRKTFGIYKIENLLNSKIYIGSTNRNFYNRWYDHKYSLRNNKHANSHLQNAWNKYGEVNFEFSVLEEVFDKSLTLQLEQIYVDQYDPEYNVHKIVGSPSGCKRSKKVKLKLSKLKKQYYDQNSEVKSRISKSLKKFYEENEEARRSISNSNLERFKDPEIRKRCWHKDGIHLRKGSFHTEETKEKISSKLKGKLKLPHSEETKEKMSRSHRTLSFEIINPEGILIKVTNLRRFCLDNGLSSGHICELLKGKRKSCKGWKIK